MSPLRIWLVGFGTVGRRVADTLDAQAGRIASRYGCETTVVGVANARDGFVYDGHGLDLRSVLAAADSGRPITGQRGARASTASPAPSSSRPARSDRSPSPDPVPDRT